MKKIVHLFNLGSRFPSQISQGLIASPGIHVSFNKSVISLGKEIVPATRTLYEDLFNADCIFRCNDEHFQIPEIDDFMDQNGLWKKMVYYDFKDAADIEYHRLEQCLVYAKRSWLEGLERKAIPVSDPRIIPLDFCILNEYLEINAPKKRVFDIAYLFKPEKEIGIRRYNVLTQLRAAGFNNALIGACSAAGRTGRRAIYCSPDNNPWVQYLKSLKQSKIVFTAFPDYWDGDSRTWEAFASGAMVFMDQTGIPSPHPFEHGKHCYIYNALDQDSITAAINKAVYYLQHDNERESIAETGYRFALEHHRPVNRIKQIFSQLES